jgi:hypothetical protein
MDVRWRLLDAIHQSLKEGNYRPAEADVLKRALASLEELNREFRSFTGLLEYFAEERRTDVLRYAVSGFHGVGLPEYTARKLSWVLLTGRRW